MLPALLLACTSRAPDPSDGGASDGGGTDGTRPWRSEVPALGQEVEGPRGFTLGRAIVHLHSSWSHDACDGDPLDEDGHPRQDCLLDLRRGLCRAGVEYAFLSDHPAHFASADWGAEALQALDGDALLPSASAPTTMRFTCDDGRAVHWFPGVEDELMPVALDRHVPGEAEERDATYNRTDPEVLETFHQAGAVRLLAHTEGRAREDLEAWVQAGLQGVEAFNLHAAFDPEIRAQDLGLDPVSWISDLAGFLAEDGTAEPDLFVLAVLQRQPVSEAHWDALNMTGPTDRVIFATAGTDAHQNVLPQLMRDGERVDSYRRMLRWFSQHLLLREAGPEAAEEALASGRFAIVFDVLGTPAGFDLSLRGADGAVYEMGQVVPGSALPAELEVGCPTLSADSPRGAEEPELSLRVLRDGEVFAEGCGAHAIDQGGVFRVEVMMTPFHLGPFLGDDGAAEWMRPYPWILSNPIRVLAP